MILNVLNKQPNILEIESFLSEDECNSILQRNFTFKKSKGYDFSTKESMEVDVRTSYTFFDLNDDLNPIRKKIHFLSSMILDDSFNLKMENLELLQLTRYTGQEKYVSHWDFFNHVEEDKISNDRIATFIVYLNDDFLEGNTTFEKLNISVKPKKGKALYFDYCYSNEINELTMHSGDPPVQGTKTILTCWIRKYPYQ